MGHFAGSFVFNGLTLLSFRGNRKRRFPPPRKPPGAYWRPPGARDRLLVAFFRKTVSSRSAILSRNCRFFSRDRSRSRCNTLFRRALLTTAATRCGAAAMTSGRRNSETGPSRDKSHFAPGRAPHLPSERGVTTGKRARTRMAVPPSAQGARPRGSGRG